MRHFSAPDPSCILRHLSLLDFYASQCAMRSILFSVLLCLSIPAANAADRHWTGDRQYWTGDNMLECLIGKGAVEMRHGVSPEDAIVMVRDFCFETTLDPNDVHDVIGEFDGDFVHLGVYVDDIYLRALRSLQAMRAARAL